MKNDNKSRITIMTPFMEQNGPFVRLEEQEGELLAEIAKQIVVLPLELKDSLTPLLGRRIALLRTDIPGREYLFRILPENEADSNVKAVATADQGQDEQTSSCSEAI
jgi:hypothetical protein